MFYLFLRTRLKLLFSDARFFVAIIFIPLVVSAMMGNALDRQEKSEMELVIVDYDQSEMSKNLIMALENKESIHIRQMNMKKAKRYVEDNQVEAAVIIPADYEAKLLSGDLQGILQIDIAFSADSRGFLSEMIAGEVFRQSGPIISQKAVSGVLMKDEIPVINSITSLIQEKYDEIYANDRVYVDYIVLPAKPPESGGLVNYPAAVASSLGLIVLFLLFGTLHGSSWLTRDKDLGVLKRFVTAGGVKLTWFLASWLSLFLVGTLLAIVLVLGSYFLTGFLPVEGIKSWLLILVYIACNCSVGLFLSTIFKRAEHLQAATPIIAIVSGFAGGCLWNQMGTIANLPIISLFTPQGWVLQALGALYAYPGTAVWLQSLVVLSGLSIILAVVAWVRLKKDRQYYS